jgi:hypothetical protein
MYEQSLVKTVEPVKLTTISRMNKGKQWKYGYDKEHDLIVYISQRSNRGNNRNTKSALLLCLSHQRKCSNQNNKWVKFEQPKELEASKKYI